MTDIHTALRNLLLADTGITGIVNTRIYPLQLPLDCTLPAIGIHRISNPIDHLTDVGTPRFQISVWTENYKQSQQLRDIVIDCLNRFRGIQDGVHIKRIVYLEATDMYEDKTDIYHIPIDFKIIHTR
jgi:hypothetical protein